MELITWQLYQSKVEICLNRRLAGQAMVLKLYSGRKAWLGLLQQSPKRLTRGWFILIHTKGLPFGNHQGSIHWDNHILQYMLKNLGQTVIWRIPLLIVGSPLEGAAARRSRQPPNLWFNFYQVASWPWGMTFALDIQSVNHDTKWRCFLM